MEYKAKVINNDSNNFNVGEIIECTGVEEDLYYFINQSGELQILVTDDFEWISDDFEWIS